MAELDEFRAETRAWLDDNCPMGARGPGPIPNGSTKIRIRDRDTRTWLDCMIEKGWTVGKRLLQNESSGIPVLVCAGNGNVGPTSCAEL
ncbi:MAG: hypothetical protein OXF68_07635 [Gammaproteobacteria bacterium]|nr:hypothetical protein [Gammaproteobacteria bacterium]MCY4342894.1 hypothetical protein [Gammaproteobacteria bacterium]